jgi:hypothetical protein
MEAGAPTEYSCGCPTSKLAKENWMAKRSVRISTRGAHVALSRLIARLDKLEKSEWEALEKRVSKKGKTKTFRAWLGVLKIAKREIPEWCSKGDNQFTIDVRPVSPRRRA